MVASAILLCWLAHLLSLTSSRRWSLRVSLVLGSVAWGTLLVLVTEVLSLFTRFERMWLLGAWTGACAVLAASCGYVLWRDRREPTRDLWSGSPRGSDDRLSRAELVMLSIIALQAFTLAMAAFVYPPNTTDSMTYHLARVMHWEQNRTVAFYASGAVMQWRGAPFAEYVIAHLQILTRGDAYANFVQWSAMVASVIGVSQIAADLGADRGGQIAAALIGVSIPMGILQATSTQNDYVVAYWAVCVAVASMQLLKGPSSWAFGAATGLALGLAALTKLTAPAHLGLFCLAVAAKLLVKLRWRALGIGAAVGMLAVCVTAGFWVRNLGLYGSPWPSPAGHVNPVLSFRVSASNAIRNLALQVPVESGVRPVDAASRYTMGWLRLIHEFTGNEPRDPGSKASPFEARASMHEDGAGSPLHTLLAALTIAACCGHVGRRGVRATLSSWKSPAFDAPLYAACLVGAYMLHSAYFIWQPWQNRLVLPLFVLGSPAVATVLFGPGRRLRFAVPTLVGVLGFCWTFGNATRPVSAAAPYTTKTRTELYFSFTGGQELLPVYTAMADEIAATSCHEIGLYIAREPFEYPIWMLLKERRHRATIRHVNPPTETLGYAPAWYVPCAVISSGIDDAWRGTKFELPALYTRDFVDKRFGAFHLYLDPRVLPAANR